MEIKNLSGLVIVSVLLLVFNSCKKDESNPIDQASFIAKATDYLPISSGKIISVKITGNYTTYDSLDKVVTSTQVSNQSYSGSVGATTIISDMIANPIYYNISSSRSIFEGYTAVVNGDVLGLNFPVRQREIYLTLLPADLSVGKEWIVNSEDAANRQVKMKLIEALGNYTNSEGNRFQNVINLRFTAQDSVVNIHDWPNYYTYFYRQINCDGNVYLAKGIGIIEARLNNYERTEKQNILIDKIKDSYYFKAKNTGVIVFTN